MRLRASADGARSMIDAAHAAGLVLDQGGAGLALPLEGAEGLGAGRACRFMRQHRGILQRHDGALGEEGQGGVGGIAQQGALPWTSGEAPAGPPPASAARGGVLTRLPRSSQTPAKRRATSPGAVGVCQPPSSGAAVEGGDDVEVAPVADRVVHHMAFWAEPQGDAVRPRFRAAASKRDEAAVERDAA